jgi:hypothetical protein
MRKSLSRIGGRLLHAGIATAATTAVVVAGTVAPALAAVAPLTLSATSGPSGGSPTITASSTAMWLSGISTPGVNFSIPACPGTYNATVVATPTSTAGNITGAVVTKISSNKAAITVPSGVVTVAAGTATKWNVCVYDGATSGSLIGSGAYTVAPGVTLTSISPASGPALGGTTITVVGSSLPTTTSGILGATLGGLPLTNIAAVNASSFTATAPTHSAGSVALTVTTAAGTQTLNTAFSYSNGIVVTPNTNPLVPNGTPALNPTLDIAGAGFSALATVPFGATLAAAPHIYLVNDTYSSAGPDGTHWTTPPITDCTSPLVISDTELICTLNLNSTLDAAGAATTTPVPRGTYTVTIVADSARGATTTINPTDISSGATFTVAPY